MLLKGLRQLESIIPGLSGAAPLVIMLELDAMQVLYALKMFSSAIISQINIAAVLCSLVEREGIQLDSSSSTNPS